MCIARRVIRAAGTTGKAVDAISDMPAGLGLPDFGQIEARRRALGVSQARLAGRAGISETTYSRHRRGKTEEPRPATLRALADALELFAAERMAARRSFP
jgi:predicted transcriptional regulator